MSNIGNRTPMIRQLNAYLFGHGARRSAIEKANTHVVDIREGRDYSFDPGGRMVFTEAYHLARGECCQKDDCAHCPFRKRA